MLGPLSVLEMSDRHMTPWISSLLAQPGSTPCPAGTPRLLTAARTLYQPLWKIHTPSTFLGADVTELVPQQPHNWLYNKNPLLFCPCFFMSVCRHACGCACSSAKRSKTGSTKCTLQALSTSQLLIPEPVYVCPRGNAFYPLLRHPEKEMLTVTVSSGKHTNMVALVAMGT